MRNILLTFLAWCCVFSLYGQAEVPAIIGGINAFDQEKYDVAIRTLTKLVVTPDSLPPRDLPKAHYYLAQSYFQVANQPNKASKFPNALLYAATHLLTTRYTDKKGTYDAMVGISEEILWPMMYNTGVEAYNDKDFTRALAFFEKAQQLNPIDPQTPLTQGYVHWQLGDTLAAIRDLEKAFDMRPDSDSSQWEQERLHGFHLLMAEGYLQQRQQQKAREWIDRGFRMFPEDPDFKRTERNFFRTFPDMAKDASQRLLEDLEKYPEDADRWMSYAQLLELQQQEELARDTYRKILKTHPDQTEAHRKLGIFHVNFASNLEMAQYTLSTREAQALTREEINCHLKKGLPHIQHLHKVEPQNMDWMNQLVSISRYLDLPERKIYRKERKVMKRKLKQGDLK